MGANEHRRHRRSRSGARRTTASSPAPGSSPTTSIRRTSRTRTSCARRTRTRRSARSTPRRRRRRRASSRSSPAPTSTGVNGLPCGWLITGTDGKPMNEPPHPVLAQGKVRHVGDPGRAGRSRRRAHQAKDAAEAIDVDYEVLPAVVNCVDALKPGAPQIHDGAPGNKCYTWALGDKAAVDAAFAKAAHVAKLDIVNNRLIPNAIEPRAAVASYNRADDSVHALRLEPEPARRAPADDGVRARPARAQGARDRARRRRRLRLEDLPLRRRDGDGVGVEAASTGRSSGRRERSEAFLSDAHGRDHVTHAELALRQGRQVPRDARADDRERWARTCRRSRRASRPSSTRRCSPASTRRP